MHRLQFTSEFKNDTIIPIPDVILVINKPLYASINIRPKYTPTTRKAKTAVHIEIVTWYCCVLLKNTEKTTAHDVSIIASTKNNFLVFLYCGESVGKAVKSTIVPEKSTAGDNDNKYSAPKQYRISITVYNDITLIL